MTKKEKQIYNKNYAKIKREATWNVKVADTLFSDDSSESIFNNDVKLKMEELGGNWKRIIYLNSSMYVSDLGKVLNKKGKEMHYCIQNNGYVSWNNTTLHRLVAFVFGKIKKFKYDPNDLCEIDHIDEDKTNNALSNLRVISHSDNIKKRDRNGNANSIKIDAYDYKTGEFLKTYNSYKEASDELKLFTPSIFYVINHRYSNTGGYAFVKHGEKYEKVITKRERTRIERLKNPIVKKQRSTRKYHPDIEVYKDNVLIGTYPNYAKCAKELHLDRHFVADRCRFHNTKPLKGYVFEYKK